MRLRPDPLGPIDPTVRGMAIAVLLSGLVAARLFPFHVVPPLCAWKRLVGVPCPACGMTRSWVHLAHGRPLEAARYNPLGAVLFVAAVLLLGYLVARLAGWIGPWTITVSAREALALRVAAVLVLAANWIWVLSAGLA